ncbi:hypothetical protein [Desulfonauticus submarinus]
MFSSKQSMPLAGRYIIFKIICTECGWEKDLQMESIDGLGAQIIIRLKKEKIKLQYRKCPECGAEVRIEERFVIS